MVINKNNGSLPPLWRTPFIVIVAGCLIAMVGFGVRSSFGLFMDPMTLANGWGRETFALAMAIQNLLWGIGVPLAGAIADRRGAAPVLIAGALCYALGIYGMAGADSSMALHLFGGVLTGLGVAFTGFAIALSAIAKVVGPDKRSLALGLGTAAGSLGQVVFSPLAQGFIGHFGWFSALLIMASFTALIIPAALLIPRMTSAKGEAESDQTLAEALREAVAHRGYLLLTLGFFVCGFHVAFITVHFPSYVKDLGMAASVGATSLALIGFFNIFGSFGSGAVGQRWSKKVGLSWIYLLRAVAISALMLAPKTELTIYLFAASMGILWLSTVPLTTGIVGQIFGMRYLSTLFGIVFLSHQLGSFLGVWLGGYLFDTYGTYDAVWWVGVILALVAALIHMLIDELPLPRLLASAVVPEGR
ncbi:MAG: MFS transporter [Gammaproteobacteria bacterium]|nr:MFS transporter [Gammaproteobacteria bacterium]